MFLPNYYVKIIRKLIIMENVFAMKIKDIIQLITHHQIINALKKVIYQKIYILIIKHILMNYVIKLVQLA